MPKRISAARPDIRIVIVTLDNHLASAVERARVRLHREMPGLHLGFHAAAEWDNDPSALEACKADVARADIVLSAMLFLDEHVRAILPTLLARRDQCDAMVGCLSAGEVVKTTKLNRFDMSGTKRSALDFLKKLRGKPGAEGNAARQMALVRKLPKILRFIPGSAQDVRAYFLTLQYWLAGSDENVAALVRFLVQRYAAGERAAWRDLPAAPAPLHYPETGLYHPRMAGRVGEEAARLPRRHGAKGRVGLLLMRSYVLAGNTAHYDGVIEALEARGLDVVPAFAAGLDNRPAVDAFFMRDGRPAIDALVSLTGFSLVGGPAYNDAKAAETTLSRLDVPYIAAHALEFQTTEQWEAGARGLSPVEATMMVAIPELDGATAPMVFGGRSIASGADNARDMRAHPERVAQLSERVAKLIALRRTAKRERKVAVVLFNFPPNAGATGTAAFLSVYASLLNTLKGMKAEGYSVEVPESVDALRDAILHGNAARYGPVPTSMPASPPTTMSAGRRTSPRSRRNGARLRAATRATARACSCSARSSATSSSASSRPSATRATRCGCSSRAASPRPTPSAPSTATCARISPPTRCSTSAPTGRSSSCPASRPASRRPAGRSG